MSSPGVRWRQPRVRQSIRTRLLVLLVGLTTISVLTVGYLGVNSVQSVGESARHISAEALRTQAEEYLRQVTVGDAQKNDLTLKRAQHDAENVARYAAGIFERPDAFTGGAYWQAEDHMFTGPDGQYMNGETDTSDVFVPNYVVIDDTVLTVLELSAYLDFVFVPTFESDPSTVAIYLGTERDEVRYYPNINIGTIVPPDFQVTQRPWYISANPENNPERKAVWSPVYADATGKGLMVTTAAPIYTSRDEFRGVIGIDVTLQDISANVEAARSLAGGYSFLVDDTGHAIALPEQGYQDILGRSAEPGELGTDLNGVTTEFAPILTEMMAGSTGFDTLKVGGKELFVAYAPLESIGWSLANVVEADKVLQAMATLQDELEASTESLVLARILPVAAAILAAVVVIGLLLTNRLADPIQRLATAAQRIGAGQWDAPLPQAGNDEIGVLSQSFGVMTAQLRESIEGLEQRVAERTADLARRATQLEAAAEVARDATAILDVEALMHTTVERIIQRFGFYHASILLVDDPREYIILRAASSIEGQAAAPDFRLRIGAQGIVAHVAQSGQPYIVSDVERDLFYFAHPDLPETRSEIALPLRVRGEVIGVLDVQSAETAAFSDEDASILQTMADQLAMAIENARLFEQTQTSLREVEMLYRDYSREAWEALGRAGRLHGYTYDQVSVSAIAADRPPEVQQALREGRIVAVGGNDEGSEAMLAVPITVRGTVVGALDIRKSEEAKEWTAEEMTWVERIADQLALALENARLLEETRRRAERERLTADITARVRDSTNVDTILRTAIRELGQALQASDGLIRLEAVDETGSLQADKGVEEMQP